jgi:hypothetical protein
MKTVTSTLVLLTLALAGPSKAAPKIPSARLLDMYAVREGDQYVVHVLASGDISQFLSDRKTGEGTYHLTLDVPAISPSTAKFDVATPFSRSFQVWPMQLGKKIYSRIEIELDIEASSVVGLENASHLFVRIHRELPPGVQVADQQTPTNPPSAEPPAAPGPGEAEPAVADGGSAPPTHPEETEAAPSEPAAAVASLPTPAAEDDLFFSLFPAPMRKQQTLFNVAAEEPLYPDEAPIGVRLGRFAVQPAIDASYIRGDNLLQTSEAPFVDNAYMIRGRVTATLLESAHDLKLVYEARYRDFQDFTLEDKLTHMVDVTSELALTPTTRARVGNHFVHGAFESQEFDPGGEVVASTDPFYRNATDAVLAFDFSERFSAEINGSYNIVEFLDTATDFFSYNTREFGGTFLYDLSPLTNLLGAYVHSVTPQPADRPMVGSVADMFLVGLRGELTPMLRGQIRGGYSTQRFDFTTVSQDFSGFVADAALTRDFGDAAALTVRAGRRTSPSSFEQNGYYVSNYARAQFITPFARNFRMTVTGALFLNGYPVPDVNDVIRNDDIFSAGAGLAYFFTPLTFLSMDYRHDQRNSNIDTYSYRSNSIQVMVGFGFLNR